MANSVTVKIIEDGPRNAIVNIVGVVDSTDIAPTPVVAINQFTGNDRGRFVGFKVVCIDHSATEGLVVLLNWNANTPQPICAISGSSDLNGRKHGGIVPNKVAGGYDGTINLSTEGYVAGRTYGFTLRVSMTKMYS